MTDTRTVLWTLHLSRLWPLRRVQSTVRVSVLRGMGHGHELKRENRGHEDRWTTSAVEITTQPTFRAGAPTLLFEGQ